MYTFQICFFIIYTLDSQASLSSCMSIKTGLFFLSDFLLYHYSNFWYYRSLLKKNQEKIKTRLLVHIYKRIYSSNKGLLTAQPFGLTFFPLNGEILICSLILTLSYLTHSTYRFIAKPTLKLQTTSEASFLGIQPLKQKLFASLFLH